jgi:hypothetical protein
MREVTDSFLLTIARVSLTIAWVSATVFCQ